MKRIRVLVVDDSGLMRDLITALLSADPAIDVVGAAPDPFVARDMIKSLDPDVITLDVEMPRMDGLTFLRKIMELRPMPVVMLSSFTQASADVTLQALESGAVDFVAKPTATAGASLDELAKELQAKVKAAARMHMSRNSRRSAGSEKRAAVAFKSSGKTVLIGASTGGVEALKSVLMNLPSNCPAILIAQHMPERFTAAFARRLDRECPMRVHEAEKGMRVEPGNVYIAPGSFHLEIAKDRAGLFCDLNQGALVSGHRPSVDVLFQSGARVLGSQAVAAILTGMGRDGADGMAAMRRAGAHTIGQNEASSLIYGMPRAAFEAGGVAQQCSLDDVPGAILQACMAAGAAAAAS